MLCREIIAVYSEIQTKHINTMCGLNLELLNVKPGGTYSLPLGFKGLINVRVCKGDVGSKDEI